MICKVRILLLSLLLIVISACSSGDYIEHYYVQDSYTVDNVVYFSVYKVVDKLKWSNISHSTKTIVLSKNYQLYSLDTARADSRFVLVKEEYLADEYIIQNIVFTIPENIGVGEFKLFDFRSYICVEGGTKLFTYDFSENRKYVRLVCGENAATLKIGPSGTWVVVESSSTPSNNDPVYLFNDGTCLTLKAALQLIPPAQLNVLTEERQIIDVEKTGDQFYFLIKGLGYSNYKVIEPSGELYRVPFLDEYGSLSTYYNWDVDRRRFFTEGTDEDLDLRMHDYGNFEVVSWTQRLGE